MGLSIRQFRQVYEELEFPFDPPADVRELAHDFGFTYETLSPNSEYAALLENLLRHGEVTTYDLLEDTSPDDSYPKRRDALFTNTFTQLERIGYAEAIYAWGKQTRTYLKYTDRQRYIDSDALDGWCNLLREWAVLEWVKQPTSLTDSHQHWDKLIAKFAPIYERVNLTLEHLPLSLVSRTRLLEIVLHHETRKQALYSTTDQIMAFPKSLWEEFALGPGGSYTSFQLEGRHRINLREWSTILNALSVDDIYILDQWALKDTYRWRKLKIPLPDFRTLNTN
jgi:hypothetical protein